MYVTAIVAASGRGLRFGSKITKPLIKIGSCALIIYCLNTLSKHPYIKDIIVVANSKDLKSIINKIAQYRIKKIKEVVLGGRRRQDSVFNALKAMDSRTDLVLVHDGVRPFIDKKTVSLVIKEAKETGAACVGVPVKATIKKIKNQQPEGFREAQSKIKNRFIIEKTLNRDSLWEIQTPQVFKKGLILKAYEKFGNMDVTDDAALVEKLGSKVKVVRGSYSNIKITTPEDLVLAEAILKNKHLLTTNY